MRVLGAPLVILVLGSSNQNRHQQAGGSEEESCERWQVQSAMIFWHLQSKQLRQGPGSPCRNIGQESVQTMGCSTSELHSKDNAGFGERARGVQRRVGIRGLPWAEGTWSPRTGRGARGAAPAWGRARGGCLPRPRQGTLGLCPCEARPGEPGAAQIRQLSSPYPRQPRNGTYGQAGQ